VAEDVAEQIAREHRRTRTDERDLRHYERLCSLSVIVPPLLRRCSSDEYAPLPWTARDQQALHELADVADPHDRRATAATLRAIDEAHGGGYYNVPDAATRDLDAASECFGGDAPVVDVQTHLVDPTRWHGPSMQALVGYLEMADPDRWGGGVDPTLLDGAAWAACVFATSETAVALLTSTPGPSTINVLTNNQIAATRDVVDRYAGTGRVLTHTIVHPNNGEAELDAMTDWRADLQPAGWKTYTLWGPPTKASPQGGWFLDDDEIGFPFLERVRALGPHVVASHKGIGGPIPAASAPAASPRDIGPAAKAFPDITFVVYHSGYERNPDGEEGAYDPNGTGVDRLVKTVTENGIGRGGNVYAELGSTWFLMLRRPREAAHVLGKLLVALGPERIVWGTDSAWYGSPQPLIDAFRAFTIPEAMQEQFGYPPLTRETKELILSHNAQRVYQCTAEFPSDKAWVTSSSVELVHAIARTKA
jgi:predicted TIM-barrel fold metal-dependent hydrolase